ncbi:GNAT family N-acetyltransferase [filamentous cyanobacterium CCT1]|nr:GNAT family N-acetyltransferase [filamentous cyanobacterium CCT1]PSN80724.1 GNAT family N-acetyltransferase [filamentous cyanobacterium CCP4]
MITWVWKPFEALSTAELYEIMKARQQVFIIEQSCIYADIDGADPQSWHLLGLTPNHELVAYLRVLPPTHDRATPAIGRVLILPAMRGQGLGRQVIAEGLRQTQQQFPGQDIVLSAQHHLEKLYREFGFQSISEPYLEDGIAHINMRWIS